MKTSTRLAVVAIALVSSVSVAAAANMSKSSTTGSGGPQTIAQDSLMLSSSQRKTAWNDISKIGTKQKAPSGFTAKVGAALPASFDTHPVPVSTADKVPLLRPYQYALLQNNKLLIVNPSDRKVAEVISQ